METKTQTPGIISSLDILLSLQNLARRSVQYAGSALRLFSVAPGCQWSSLPCVPFANRSFTAMFETIITRIRCGFGPLCIASIEWCQSPARCKFHRLWARHFLRRYATRCSEYHCCDRTPRARTLPLILMLWLCTLAMRPVDGKNPAPLSCAYSFERDSYLPPHTPWH